MKKIIILSISILLVGLAAVLKSANPGSEKGVVESGMVIVKTYEACLLNGYGSSIVVAYSDLKTEKIELDPGVQKNQEKNAAKIYSVLNKIISEGYQIRHTSSGAGEGNIYNQYILTKE